MNPESEAPKPPSEAENIPNDEGSETVRKPLLLEPSDVPEESDKPRSPGAQERDTTIPTSPPEEDEVEVIRRPVIPISEPSTSDDPRSPGAQERDAIASPIPSPASPEATEVVRKPVAPPPVESDDEASE